MNVIGNECNRGIFLLYLIEQLDLHPSEIFLELFVQRYILSSILNNPSLF